MVSFVCSTRGQRILTLLQISEAFDLVRPICNGWSRILFSNIHAFSQHIDVHNACTDCDVDLCDTDVSLPHGRVLRRFVRHSPISLSSELTYVNVPTAGKVWIAPRARESVPQTRMLNGPL